MSDATCSTKCSECGLYDCGYDYCRCRRAEPPDLDEVFATMPERYLEDLRQSMSEWAALTFPIAAETWPES